MLVKRQISAKNNKENVTKKYTVKCQRAGHVFKFRIIGNRLKSILGYKNSNYDEIHYCANVLSHFASSKQEFLEILIFSWVLLPEHI